MFACDLAASQLCSNTEQLNDKSADDLAVLYRDVMTQLLDKHCPVAVSYTHLTLPTKRIV